jgi:ATP-dependent exoDNAse (exonuclease V) beta subunit
LLKLGAEIEFGLQETVLKKDEGESLAAYHAWAEARAAAIAAGSRPRYEVFLASEASEGPAERCAVEYVAASAGGRPSYGRRFGSLVHEVMRDVELDATAEAVRRGAEMSGRVLGAPAEEIDAAGEAVVAALANPLLARARASARQHREYPFSLTLGDGRLLEGVIDLAFVEDGAWVIVDFKTDADWGANRARYERQLQWYAFALRQLTGIPAKAVLLGL